MADSTRSGQAKASFMTLPPQTEDRLTRRLGLRLGLVPLPEMSQAEADWVFEQALRVGGEDVPAAGGGPAAG